MKCYRGGAQTDTGNSWCEGDGERVAESPKSEEDVTVVEEHCGEEEISGFFKKRKEKRQRSPVKCSNSVCMSYLLHSSLT